MDYYLNDENVINRLVEEWNKYGKIIIAYDYDDTVFDFWNKGREYTDVITLLQRCQKVGAYFIVFTANDDIEGIKNYLTENKIPYDKINENMVFIKFTSRKIYYNILLDDRAGLSSAYNCLLKTINIIEKENKENE
jgi:hypothetical protein